MPQKAKMRAGEGFAQGFLATITIVRTKTKQLGAGRISRELGKSRHAFRGELRLICPCEDDGCGAS